MTSSKNVNVAINQQTEPQSWTFQQQDEGPNIACPFYPPCYRKTTCDLKVSVVGTSPNCDQLLDRARRKYCGRNRGERLSLLRFKSDPNIKVVRSYVRKFGKSSTSGLGQSIDARPANSLSGRRQSVTNPVICKNIPRAARDIYTRPRRHCKDVTALKASRQGPNAINRDDDVGIRVYPWKTAGDPIAEIQGLEFCRRHQSRQHGPLARNVAQRLPFDQCIRYKLRSHLFRRFRRLQSLCSTFARSPGSRCVQGRPLKSWRVTISG